MPPADVFECQGCGRVCPRDRRRGRRLQSFCSRRACQRKRKALWQREKLARDPDYRADQKEAQKLWREQQTDYWSRYRKRAAKAARRNRVRQRKRDRRRRLRKAGAVSPAVARNFGEEDVGRYVLEPLGKNAGGQWEVVLLPVAEAGGDVLAKMDALKASRSQAQSGS